MRNTAQYNETSSFRKDYGREMIQLANDLNRPVGFGTTVPTIDQRGRAFMDLAIGVVERDQIEPSEFPELLGIEYSEYLELKKAYNL